MSAPDDWDQRQLRHTDPCKECPFRKRSLPGYLGGHPLEPYRQPPSAGMPTTCHCTDKGAGDPRSSFCAGALAVIMNDPAVEPLPEYAAAAHQVGKRDDCFDGVEAFAEHHKDADAFAARCRAAFR